MSRFDVVAPQGRGFVHLALPGFNKTLCGRGVGESWSRNQHSWKNATRGTRCLQCQARRRQWA